MDAFWGFTVTENLDGSRSYKPNYRRLAQMFVRPRRHKYSRGGRPCEPRFTASWSDVRVDNPMPVSFDDEGVNA